MDEFIKRKIAVVVVAFESLSGAKTWLAETQSKLPMFIDPERKIYKMFGLSRSIHKVFKIDVMKYYGEQLLKGALPEAQGQSDFLQMGGDFTFGRKGSTPVVTFCYPSQSSTDRPEISDILKASEYRIK